MAWTLHKYNTSRVDKHCDYGMKDFVGYAYVLINEGFDADQWEPNTKINSDCIKETQYYIMRQRKNAVWDKYYEVKPRTFTKEYYQIIEGIINPVTRNKTVILNRNSFGIDNRGISYVESHESFIGIIIKAYLYNELEIYNEC